MALSVCGAMTDLHDQELAKHGDPSFPIACYADDLAVHKVPWHWHEEWEYAVVIEGSGDFFVENHHIQLSAGDGIFINSKALHTVSDSTNTLKLHSAVFHPRLIGGNTDSCFWTSLITPFTVSNSACCYILHQDTPWGQDVIGHFMNAWEAAVSEPDNYQNIVRFELSSAIHILIKHADFTESSMSAQELATANRIRIMLEYIEAHYDEDLTVDALARTISASESVVLRCFQQMLHTSPIRYVKNIRIKKAADLLRTTNKSAKEIALACGFNDISYFTRAFKEIYHQTPGSYRKE
ncbi:MAG: AraC family transcriptional regulator [Eubacteriales bacterium]|nr:AraC family transcriptional regulator [Eubacteriales bacterium]